MATGLIHVASGPVFSDYSEYSVSHKSAVTKTVSVDAGRYICCASDGGASGTGKDPPTISIASGTGTVVHTKSKKGTSDVDSSYQAYGSIRVSVIEMTTSGSLSFYYRATNHSACGFYLILSY